MNKEIAERIKMIKEGKVPDGYRKVRSGIIPNQWNEEKLRNLISELEGGVSVNSEDGRINDRDFGVLKTGCVFEGTFKPQESKKIKADEIMRAKVNPKKGKIIVSRANTPELVGSVGLVDKDYNNLFLSDKLWQADYLVELDARWLTNVLSSTKIRNRITLLATGTSKSMQNISKESFLSLKIVVPHYEEQLEIANKLYLWDISIELKEKLLKEKQKQKKGLMEKLLSGKVRLSGFDKEWKTVKLGSVLDTINKESLDNPKDYNLLTVKLHVKGIEATNKKPNATEKGRPYYLRESGELLIGRQNFHNGGIGIIPTDMNGYIASNAITSLKVIKGKLEFYFYYLSNKSFYKRVGNIIGGTGQKEISETMLKKLKITIPTEIEEQKQIAKIIKTSDKEIKLLKKEIEELKKQKKGLMQLLLTGIVRVKCD
ncbi:restriction endonuclease subunit S [Clostridium botulinum]|uniref:restriction endonuclease subunit S n=1 Tax=Clostridium botulinum TaxID=1491 RepID=UPI000773DD5C|nr:restriction endonuclease subunit S [Clostridium botulinum]MBY6932176.1 restriction endonuclease subunit S [Clostridium botulinum]